MLLFFNLLIIGLLIAAVLIVVFSAATLRRHWRTSAAGLLVLAVTGFTNGLYFIRTGHLPDTIAFAIALSIGIAFLLSADAHRG